jgi:hypothetical protein
MKGKTMSISEKRTENLREESGNFISTDPLVSFLYLLMRDHLPTGDVEELFQTSIETPNSLYTNGWLAKYAENLANGLKTSDTTKLADKLVDVLGFDRASEKDVSMERPAFKSAKEALGVELLKDKLIVEEGDDASIELLRDKGIITQEEYDRVISELNEEVAKEEAESVDVEKVEEAEEYSDEEFAAALERKEGDAIQKWKNTYDALGRLEEEENK